MPPQLVNAVNLPVRLIELPAAILQRRSSIPRRHRPPTTAPSARSSGTRSATLFDDRREVRRQGQAPGLWTPEDLAHFEASSAALAAQFDAYKPFPDVRRQ